LKEQRHHHDIKVVIYLAGLSAAYNSLEPCLSTVIEPVTKSILSNRWQHI